MCGGWSEASSSKERKGKGKAMLGKPRQTKAKIRQGKANQGKARHYTKGVLVVRCAINKQPKLLAATVYCETATPTAMFSLNPDRRNRQ